MINTSLKRDLDEDDIYATRNSMRSAQNTDAFAKLWAIELQKKSPSIIRVIVKLYGLQILLMAFLYSFTAVVVG